MILDDLIYVNNRDQPNFSNGVKTGSLKGGYMKFWKWLLMMLTDQRGDDQPGAGDNGGASGDAGQGAGDAGAGDGSDSGGDDGQAGADDGAAPAAAPKYGDFGDTPKTIEEAQALIDKIYEEHSKIAPEYKNLTTKAGLTEKNLANTRKALQAVGLRAVQDTDGNIQLEALEAKKTERQKRFTDTHKQQFSSFFKTPKDAEDFLGMMSLLVQDNIDDQYEIRNQESTKHQKAIQAFSSAKKEANSLMMGYFPMLEAGFGEDGKPTSATFNEALYDRATEIWENEVAPDGIPYKRKAEGELLSALKAAWELKIPMQQMVAAKKAGIEAGKAGKRIIGPVDGKGEGKGAGGKLGQEEYLKLSPEKKEEYDKQQLGIK